MIVKRVLAHRIVAACAAIALTAACTSSTGDGGNESAGQFPVNTNDEGTPTRGGTLHMLGTADVDFMDPNISYNYIGYLSQRMWSRQLLAYPAVVGKTTTPAPDVVTELPTMANGGITDGGSTVRLTIKPGVRWDTTPARQVTAADAVRAVKRACNPARPFGGMPNFESLIVGLSAYCEGFAKVDANSASAMAQYQNSNDIAGASVDPADPQTLVFKLTSPTSYFVDMLAMPVFSPVPAEYDQYIPASAELAQHTIANGPYRITKYTPTREIVYGRNPAWDAATDDIRKAYVDTIEVNQTGNAQTIQTQLQANNGAADMAWNTAPPNSVVPGLIASKDKNLNLTPNLWSSPYLVFNTVSPNNDGALSSAAVRQAITRGIDRDKLIVDLSGPQVSPPLTHVLPAGLSGTESNTSPNPHPFDEGKAKADLTDAGHESMTFKVLYPSDSSDAKSVFLTLQQQLSKIGVTVEGITANSADFYTKYVTVPSVARAGTWDVAIAQWGPDWYGDAARSYFGPLFYGNDGNPGSAYPPNGSNYGFYNNSEVNKLIEKASSEPDSATASKLWAEADAVVTNDAAIYPITSPMVPTYHSSRVHNTIVIPNYSQIDPTNVWLSER